jgi:hypothetical protein
MSSETSASISYTNTVEASASASVETKHASAGVGVSAKAGTEVAASAGLDGKNAYIEASYSDTTEAHVTADGSVQYSGVGGSGSVDAYAKSGNEADAHIKAGANGLDVGANVSSGSCVGVDGEGTVALREASATAGTGVSVGEHFEAGGSAKATIKHGKATVGVSGDVAALVGLDVDASVTVNTNQIKEDTVTVVQNVTPVTNTVVSSVRSAATTTVNAIKKGTSGAYNSVKKAFRWH